MSNIKKVMAFALSFILVVMNFVGTIPSTNAQEASIMPVIIQATWNAEPGQAIALHGENFGSMDFDCNTDTYVAVQPLTKYRGPLLPENASMHIRLVNVQNNLIQGVMPESISNDLFAVWVKTDVGWSDAVFINRAQVFWASERTVYPGQEIRLFGRNFASPNGSTSGPQAKLVNVNDGSIMNAKVVEVTDYTLDIKISDKVNEGERYTVMVTNGAGGEYGWVQIAEEEAFTVVKLNNHLKALKGRLGVDAAFLDNIPHNQLFNVKKFGAKGNGQNDDTSPIQQALDQAEQEGGGIVFLPEGVYSISSINIPSHTILLGESSEKTSLVFNGTLVPDESNIPPNSIYGNSVYFITSSGYEIGFAKLSLINEIKRPVDDSRRRLSGWVNMVKINGTWNSVPLENIGRGYFVKDVHIRNVDGGGVEIHSLSDIIIEDSVIDVTHSAVFYSTREGYSRIRNNVLTNTQRPLIVQHPASRAWIEGNTLNGKGLYLPNDEIRYEPPQTARTQEHRYMDLSSELNYVANNHGEGAFGSDKNDGEGILFQRATRLAYSRVSQADSISITDDIQSFSPYTLKDAKIIIIGGKGIGQMRTIKTNSAHRIEIDKPWRVIPDNTSVYTVDKNVNYHNIVVGNQLFAKLNKAAIMFYTKDYDNIVSDNIIKNSGGIWMSANQNLSQMRADFSFFAYVKGNEINGAANSEHGEANHVVIGPFADGGRSSYVNDVLKGTVVYGNEYRGNRITGIGTDSESLAVGNGWNLRYVTGSGIDIASINSSESYPFAQGVIVEGNRVENTIAGVHLTNTAYDTLLKDNDFEGNGVEIDDTGSVRTFVSEGQNILPSIPTISAARIMSSGAVSVSWSSYYVSYYTVMRSESANGPWDILVPGIRDSQYVDETAFGVPYYYRVIAHNEFGDSWSAFAQAQVVMRAVGTMDTPGRAMDVCVNGNYAYVADLGGGLQIIDKSDSSSPTIVATMDTPGNARGVFVDENYAYVADETEGLQIVDISNPASPAIVSSLATRYAKDIYVSGEYAYVADSSWGFKVIDVSDPAHPVLKASIAMGNVSCVSVRGNYAYVTNGSAGLKIVDVSNPVKPIIVGVLDTPGDAQGIYLSGDYIYVADGKSGLLVIDISNPNNPFIVSTVITYDASDPYGTGCVYVDGVFAYVGNYGNSSKVVRVSDPVNPIIIGSITTSSNVSGVAKGGEYVYIANSFSGLTVVGLEE